MSLAFAVRQGPSGRTMMVSKLPQLVRKATGQLSRRSAISSRAFHASPPAAAKHGFFSSRTTALLASPALRSGSRPAAAAGSSFIVSRIASAGGRSYSQDAASAAGQGQGSLLRKLLVGGAIFGGTLVAVNVVFNRETRDDGGMPAYEREYLNNTFLHTGLGIGIIGLTARQMIQSGFVYRIMVTNPWVVAIGGLGLSFATMIGTRSISPDK